MVARKNNSLHPKQAKPLFPVAKAVSFYATYFAKNNENGCKDQELKEKTAYQNTGNRDFGGKMER